MEEATNFSITKELALSCDISIACWCPTMDLCAVVSCDGQLHLHRMDWQMLWAISPEALITAVCWRPDGKEIALGHANGAISILTVETGDVVAEHKVHYAGIATLSWADQADSDQQSSPNNAPLATAAASQTSSKGSLFSPQQSIQPHQRYKRLFVPPVMEPHPPSSTEPLPDPYDLCMEAAGAAAWPAERPGLSLLTAADARGLVSLWLQGQVQVAELAGGLAGSTDSDDKEGEQQHEPYNLLHVVPTSQLDQVLTVHHSPSGGVVVVSHSLQLLQQHQQPLQQCTALFSQLQSFLKAAVKCVEVCGQDWSSAMADFRKRFDTQLKQELADQGSTITVPQQELLLLLATSCCTPPLQSFLGSTLGEAGLRRLARALDATASGLHTALLERVMPLLELVLFLLGELRGCVASGGGGEAAAGGWMGLQVSRLQQLELNAAALLLRTEQLRRAVTTMACQYRAFFTWLLKTIRQLEGLEGSPGDAGADAGTPLPVCQEVIAFLKGQFVHDLVGPELTGSSLSLEARARSEALFYQGIPPAETHQLLALLMPRCPVTPPKKQQQQQQQGQQSAKEMVQLAAEACSRPLAQQLQHLVSVCEEAFEQPVVVISPSIAAPTGQLQLLPNAPASGAASSSSSSSSPPVVVAPPLLQPKRCEDLHVYVCCAVPAAVAAAAGAATGQQQQQQLLLLVRAAPEVSPLYNQQQQQRPSALPAEAVLLQLLEGHTAAAWSLYKDQQLALLVQHDEPGTAGSHQPGSSSLHLLELSAAPWAAMQQQQPPRSSSSSVLEQCLQQGALVAVADLPQRSRQLHHGTAGQLAVSRTRGLASLVTDMQHLLLLDLEENECEEEQEEEEDGDDDMSEE